MTRSVRLTIGRWGSSLQRIGKRLVQGARHFIVKSEPGDNGGLLLDHPIGANSGPCGGQTHDMQRAEITAGCYPIDNQLTALGQVNKNGSLGFLGGHAALQGNYPNLTFLQVHPSDKGSPS